MFCGNLDNDTRHSDLDRLFSKYGKVDRIDMKSGMLLSIPYYLHLFSFSLAGVAYLPPLEDRNEIYRCCRLHEDCL